MILDTSVLYDVVVGGARSETARRFIRQAETLWSPDLIRIEMASALTRSVRRKEMSGEAALLAYRVAVSLVPDVEDSTSLISRAFEMSLDLVHPCADCIFLALAENRSVPLATSDARFALKLAGTSYARLIHLIEA